MFIQKNVSRSSETCGQNFCRRFFFVGRRPLVELLPTHFDVASAKMPMQRNTWVEKAFLPTQQTLT